MRSQNLAAILILIGSLTAHASDPRIDCTFTEHIGSGVQANETGEPLAELGDNKINLYYETQLDGTVETVRASHHNGVISIEHVVAGSEVGQGSNGPWPMQMNFQLLDGNRGDVSCLIN